MLIDEVDIIIKAGDGGRGKVSFGKFERSGPDGGNGGKGGDLYIEASSDLTLLSNLLSKPLIAAEDGVPGGKEKRAGKNAEDFILQLPVGSLIRDKETNEIFELEEVGQKILICKGGDGGIGNFDMRSSTNTTPRNTIPPKKGVKRSVAIVLRFIADYGLIGLPSAGKSSLLNELTNANVKVASYHFTTLSPNLGVLKNRKIIADIPGLIEGASDGKGLGIKFLKHIQKVSLILHCISSDSLDPIADYKTVRNELAKFDQELLEKEEIILVTKSDLIDTKELKKIVTKLKKLKREIITTSIHDSESIDELLKIL